MLLTLGLPVFNGEQCIGLTLQSIINAFNTLSLEDKDQIEILISDNASNDCTQEVVNRFIANCLTIRYVRNEKNLGYDGNIDSIVKKAQGQYVWFLGCGEQIKEDALARLIFKLQNTNYTNIVLDFDIYDARKDKIVEDRIYNFDTDIVIKGKNDFSQNKYGPAVSSNIVNKKLWDDIAHEKFVVDGWCHIERILSMIALNDYSETLISPNPYFTLYREADGWWTRPNSYLLLLLLLHIKVIRAMLKKGYDKGVVKQLELKQSRIALLIAIVQSKELGMNLNRKIIKDLVDIFQYNLFFWFIAFPLLLLPKSFMCLPRSAFKMLKFCKQMVLNVKNSFS